MTSRATVRDIRIRLCQGNQNIEVKTPKHEKLLACREEWKISQLPQAWIMADDRDLKSFICTFCVQKVKAMRKGREKLEAVV